MRFLLDFVYLIACILLSPWLVYRLCTAGRRDFAMRFGVGLRDSLASCIWLHGSSAGEVAVLRPLVAMLERDHPGTPLVISAFTATGLATARKLYARHRVVPLPVDLSFVVARYLRSLNPRLLVVAESEFWPNLIGCTHSRGVPVALVNGKMSAKSFSLHARTRLVTRVLASFSMLAMQTEEHAQRLLALGVERARLHVTGNMKYDLARPSGDAASAAKLRVALGFAQSDVVIIGGSLHDGEDEALLDAYAAARERVADAALVIVPRYPADADVIERRARERGFAVTRKTAIDAGAAQALGNRAVLIVDTVGELARMYAVADLAFVGGSLFFRGANKGGHNLMEPAILGVPVLFGPYNFSFKETVEDLLAADAGKLVRDAAELRAVVASLVADRDARRELGSRARRVVEAKRGATARNYALLAEFARARP
ncbi:MAG TPA: glycosyltransferase N-terminal domain-containing protein [Gammaproteobacteria bacterium]|nr:glycosyltransferase N-terminal domain-containing protein [Gammaproteobacteria bacterium]